MTPQKKQKITPQERLARLEKQISENKDRLDLLYSERQAARSAPPRLTTVHPMLAMNALTPKTYRLVTQGDSWFDYPPSWDLIDWLSNSHGHDIDNIGVAGSTLNDIVYGPVPKNWLGISQSDDVNRLVELIHRIDEKKPQAVLLSGGGNDIAGPEFFSFLNNALSGLQNPNVNVLEGVVNQTFEKAYCDLIETIIAKAEKMGYELPIFVHGYDYPWPDGRGFTVFNFVGPWFEDTFNKKNFPYKNNLSELLTRHDILRSFMDAFNSMLKGIETKYSNVVHYVDLRGTLQTRDEWANELHPKKEGFGKLADKINLALHQFLP